MDCPSTICQSSTLAWSNMSESCGTSLSDLLLSPSPDFLTVILAKTFFELRTSLSFVLCTLSLEKVDLFNIGRVFERSLWISKDSIVVDGVFGGVLQLEQVVFDDTSVSLEAVELAACKRPPGRIQTCFMWSRRLSPCCLSVEPASNESMSSCLPRRGRIAFVA